MVEGAVEGNCGFRKMVSNPSPEWTTWPLGHEAGILAVIHPAAYEGRGTKRT